MNKKTIAIILILIFSLATFFSLPYNNTVSATSVNYSFGFEGTTAGTNITNGLPVGSDNIFTSHIQGTWSSNLFCLQSTTTRSGTRTFMCFKSGSIQAGWLNATYSKSTYLTNFSWYNYAYDVANGFYFVFYNNTLGTGTIGTYFNKAVVVMEVESNKVYYINEGGGAIEVDSSITGGTYKLFRFEIMNSLGDVNYYADNTAKSGVSRNPSYIESGYRIDRLYIYASSGSGVKIDDLNWTLSDSYNISGGGTFGSCASEYNTYEYIGYNPSSYQADSYTGYYYVFAEFGNNYETTGTIHGIEVMVSTNQISTDSDMSNYFLWLNGYALGNPCGYHSVTNGYMLEWVTDMFIENETLSIEMYHNYLNYGLNFATRKPPTIAPYTLDSYLIFSQSPELLDGSLSLSAEWNEYKLTPPIWKVFIGNIIPPIPNPHYQNSIDVTGDGINESDGIQWLWRLNTAWFNVHVNDTSYGYSLHVYHYGVEMGNFSSFPITLDKYEELFSYVPLENGIYNVTLQRGNNIIISKNFFVKNNTNLEYQVFTYPNPSYTNNDYNVVAYIKDNSLFSYYHLCAFLDSNDTSTFSKSFGGSQVGSLENYYYSFQFSHSQGTVDYHYWRIFGSDDNIIWIPLGNIHPHKIDRGLSDVGYIVSDKSTSYVGDNVHISGYHPPSSSYALFVGNNLWHDVTNENSFNYQYTFTVKGTYTFYLKEKINNVWTNIDSVMVLVSEHKDEQNGTGGINLTLSPPISYIVGAIIIVIFMLIPILLTKNTSIDGFAIGLISLIMGIVGMVITILLGYLPAWIIIVIIVICALVIMIMWMRNRP